MRLENTNYLKVADVQGGETITFLTEGEWVKSAKFTYDDGTPKQDFVIKIQILDVEKSMRLNKTNREILVAAYGKETSEWIGRNAKVTKEKVMIGGKKMDMIILVVE